MSSLGFFYFSWTTTINNYTVFLGFIVYSKNNNITEYFTLEQ